MKPENQGSWQYNPRGGTTTATAEPPVRAPVTPAAAGKTPPPSASVSWTASEYIEHDRGSGWYLTLIVGTVFLAGLVYLMTKDYFATAVIPILGVIVAVYAKRKPRQITYELSSSGLRVGQKLYTYSQFKSFGVLREGDINSVNLVPIKKFMPPVSVYFAAPDEEQITTILGAHLPYAEQRPDGLDDLVRRLKF